MLTIVFFSPYIVTIVDVDMDETKFNMAAFKLFAKGMEKSTLTIQ